MKILFRSLIIFTIISVLAGCSPLQFSRHETAFKPEQRDFSQDRPIEWALVLGAGGSKGIAHIGVLEALETEGLKPDLIVGCSAGAIVGALYAEDGSVNRLKTLFDLDHRKAIRYSVGMFGILDTHKFESYINSNLHARDFSQLKIPYANVATNLEFGDLTVFSKGPLLVPSIVASAAVPGAFRPYKISDQYFVDGAVANPVPVEVAKKFGAKKIVAVDISSLLPLQEPNHLFGIVKRSTEISYVHQIRLAAREADVVIDFDFRDIGTFSLEYNQELYKAGLAAGRAAIPKIKEALSLAIQ